MCILVLIFRVLAAKSTERRCYFIMFVLTTLKIILERHIYR